MKITKIQFYNNKTFIQNRKNNNQNTEATVTNPISYAYQDFNLSFKALPPEKFYEAEHNIKYMPRTMKEYLNENNETKKHLPPEQIMNQSFKFLELADNVENAKEIYPNEPLFENLHEASTKGRSGILSDIKLGKEMSETPLFADGNDNLGVYLLKKIYLEGKTIKEINKDFYEKDLNPEYKGIITQPITYGTTSAYGIRYPKTDFWNSFISTRDEYRRLYPRLPKQTKSELKKELDGAKEKKPYVRKYKIKKYQKEQLKQDIKQSKGDNKALEKAIRKRFTKNDPEASFIVKYLSPIMTIAADRIHLSEEERFFAESEKTQGKKLDNFFASFWKAKPELLDQYSTAITDTIELFEENYGSGGLIPINNDFQIITDKVENKNPIDFVPEEFIELLDYTQTIVPARLKRLENYETKQKEWNDHFLWRYGEISEAKPADTVTKETNEKISNTELLEQVAKEKNAQYYTLNSKNGEQINLVLNVNEVIEELIKKEYRGFPPKFIKLLTTKMIKHPLMTENAKLSFVTQNIADDLNDSRILSKTEQSCITNAIKSELQNERAAASMASLDVIASLSKSPEKIYQCYLENSSQECVNEYNALLLKYGNDTKIKAKLDELYDNYRKPFSQSELTKIIIILLNYIRNFDPNCINDKNSVLYGMQESVSNLNQLKQLLSNKLYIKNFRNATLQFLNESKRYYVKTLLSGDAGSQQYKAKLEVIAHNMFRRFI